MIVMLMGMKDGIWSAGLLYKSSQQRHEPRPPLSWRPEEETTPERGRQITLLPLTWERYAVGQTMVLAPVIRLLDGQGRAKPIFILLLNFLQEKSSVRCDSEDVTTN
jgi:hypothetical protein